MFEWDDAKDAANRKSHGIGFSEAERFDWAAAIETIDDRRDYGEVRFIALGPVDRRLHVVAYTWRGPNRRIISLRKANDREIRRHDALRRPFDK